MVSFMEKENLSGQTEPNIKENSKKMRSQAKVDTTGQMAVIMKEKFLMVFVMVLVPILTTKKEWFMKENGRMDSDMAMVFLNIEMGRSMTASGKRA